MMLAILFLNVPSYFYDIILFSFSFQLCDLSSTSLSLLFLPPPLIVGKLQQLQCLWPYTFQALHTFLWRIHPISASSITCTLLTPKWLILSPLAPELWFYIFNLLLGISTLMFHQHVKSSVLIFLFTTALPFTPRTSFSTQFPCLSASALFSQCLKFRILKSFSLFSQLSKAPQAFPFQSDFTAQTWVQAFCIWITASYIWITASCIWITATASRLSHSLLHYPSYHYQPDLL